MLRLPNFEDFSPEQQAVFDLPLRESYLITGPPGSGKTVMAIYRAAHLHRTYEQPTLLLMYGRLLSRYSIAAVKGLGIESQVLNYHKWFRAFFHEQYGRPPPMATTHDFDWNGCYEIIGANPPPPRVRPHLIVDEGQDMPQQFYVVVRAVAASMTVFADENQQITENRSTVEEIKAATGIRSRAQLSRNFRNTRAIAAVAAKFYTGAGAAPVELRDNAEDGDRPVLDHDKKLYGFTTRLINYESANSTRQIGVFVPYSTQLKSLYNRLQGKTRNSVQIYLSTDMRDRKAIDFGKPGIKLISYTSAKGLEFDAVFLPELQANKADPTSVGYRMSLYVMTSRAVRELYFAYSGEGEPASVKRLPLDLIEDRRG
jgi:DNA helicase IV